MTYHLYAIGNALVDTEYEVSDAQLQAAGVEKRHMTLIDAARRTELLKHVHNVKSHRTGGGSAGNTVVALAQLGGRAFYSCRVADDELGDFYTKDLLSHGVATNLTHTKPPQGQTGSCMVMVTPDAERSMSTFLGATAEIDEAALHPHDIVKARVYYMEGYLAASPSGLAAAVKGRLIAKQAGVKLATTLDHLVILTAVLTNRFDGDLRMQFIPHRQYDIFKLLLFAVAIRVPEDQRNRFRGRCGFRRNHFLRGLRFRCRSCFSRCAAACGKASNSHHYGSDQGSPFFQSHL